MGKLTIPSCVYSIRLEVSQRRLLSSGASKNGRDPTGRRVLEGLAPLAPQKLCLWQFKTIVKYVVGRDETSGKPETLEIKDIRLTKPAHVYELFHPFDHTCGFVLYALHPVDVSS